MKINFVTNNIYFKGGLKTNLRRGEKVLKEYKKEYPYLKSSTHWQQRIDKMEDKRGGDFAKCQIIIDQYDNKINDMRIAVESSIRPKKELKKLIAQHNLANCGEITDIISEILRKKKIKHKQVGFDIWDGFSTGKDHIFCVIGTKKKADLTNPSTWGNSAVIIDGWLNFVLSIPDAIREYENFYMAHHRPAPFYSDFDFKEEKQNAGINKFM